MNREKIMDNNLFIKDYIDEVKKDEKAYLDDFRRLKKLEVERGYLYHGEPIPFQYQGFFINEKIEEDFKYIINSTNEIIKIVTDSYLKDKRVRELFGFDKRLEELILHDPGYDIPVPIGRYDIFYKDRDDFSFCEINTDGSSAMFEDYAIADLLLESKIIKKMDEKHNLSIKSYELFDSWVKLSLDFYRRVMKRDAKTVAILDFLEIGTPDEFQKFKLTYEKHGVDCEIVDVREVVFDGKNLVYKGKVIDLVYRRMVTSEMMRRYDDAKEFIRAYKNNAFLCIGSFRSQVAHNKLFFEVLRHDIIKEKLPDNLNEFVNKHIPFTKRFKGDREVLLEVIKNKDKYILKPTDMNAARGVYVGRELDEEEFRKRVENDFNKDYIYQEFILPKTYDFLEEEDNGFKVIKRGNMVGLFSYMNEFRGCYTRMGKEDIIGSIREYVAAPGLRY